MAELLIDNMRLPKNLYGAHVIIKPNGDVQDYLNGAVFAKATQLPSHGRLIDADELMKKIREEADYPSHEWCTAIDQIRNAPTIVEASDKTEIPTRNRICPYYQGTCDLDEDIVCYCSSSYEMCDKYREANK